MDQIFSLHRYNFPQLARVRHGYLKFCIQNPKFIPSFNIDMDGNFVNLQGDQTLLVIGNDLDNPEGYLRFSTTIFQDRKLCYSKIASSVVGSCNHSLLSDSAGRPISIDQLEQHLELPDHKKHIVVNNVQFFETFRKGEGLGTKLIEHLVKKHPADLVYFMATPPAVEFYCKRGFSELRLRARCDRKHCIHGIKNVCGNDYFVPMYKA